MRVSKRQRSLHQSRQVLQFSVASHCAAAAINEFATHEYVGGLMLAHMPVLYRTLPRVLRSQLEQVLARYCGGHGS